MSDGKPLTDGEYSKLCEAVQAGMFPKMDLLNMPFDKSFLEECTTLKGTITGADIDAANAKAKAKAAKIKAEADYLLELWNLCDEAVAAEAVGGGTAVPAVPAAPVAEDEAEKAALSRKLMELLVFDPSRRIYFPDLTDHEKLRGLITFIERHPDMMWRFLGDVPAFGGKSPVDIYKNLLDYGGDIRLSEEDPYSTRPVQLKNGRFVRLHLSVSFKKELFDYGVLSFTKCNSEGGDITSGGRGRGHGKSHGSRSGKGRGRGRGKYHAGKSRGNRSGGGGAKPSRAADKPRGNRSGGGRSNTPQ